MTNQMDTAVMIFTVLFFVDRFFNSKPSYYRGARNEPLKEMTVGNLIDFAAENYPNREAIVSIHQNRRITFFDLKHEVNSISLQ